MAAEDVLKDPTCSVASAVTAAKRLFGASVVKWEPDTVRISLREKLGHDDDGLMAKLLAGATVLNTNAWSYDHAVFFAFALACCGIPADGTVPAHPTPEQCCWAVDEIQVLTGSVINADQGFDPQTVDPAIAVLLHDDGHVYTHELLRFVQDELDALDKSGSKALRDSVAASWAKLSVLKDSELRQGVAAINSEALQIQIAHLAHCELYVRERRVKRAQHFTLIGTRSDFF